MRGNRVLFVARLVVGAAVGVCFAPAAQAQALHTPEAVVAALEPSSAAIEQLAPAVETQPVNPWSERPACATMFLKGDWQLSAKQKACNWWNNGVLASNAMLGAVWSAKFSQSVDLSSERGDGFATRFGRKFGQNAIKSTGIYLGAIIAREDPRKKPPYLGIGRRPPVRGFFKRTASAIGGNFISYRCVEDCSEAAHVKKTPAISRVLGSLGSGFGGELLTYDRPDSLNHALRGSASAYGSTFTSALFDEFKPELSAVAGRVLRLFGGGR